MQTLAPERTQAAALRVVSADGTVKLRFTSGQHESYESCLLNLPYRAIPKVVCVSTQVGCPFDCLFCAVARESLRRTLSGCEILNQVLYGASDELWNGGLDDFEVAAMGTGEPLCALDEVLTAVRMAKRSLPSLKSLNLATVGIPEKLLEYANQHIGGVSFQLQLSLHATSNEQRAQLMPRAARFDIVDILSASLRFSQLHGTKTTVNYLLLDRINDSPDDAARLASLLSPESYEIKLSILNRNAGTRFLAASPAAFDAFCSVLRQRGFSVRVFASAGVDIGAGCGQFSNALRF